jgi:DNA repair exonuclease SbcCD ATPase subunit
MKVVRLQVRNFMGLREIDFKPDKVNVINGRNRQGKTSVIRAIEAAFQEGDQSVKIRHGADSAEILIELDQFYLQRGIDSNGKTRLVVATSDGEVVRRPQEFLNSVVGGFSFNPAEFFLLDKKKQVEYLLESFPIKVTKEEVIRWVGELPAEFPEELLKAHGLVVVQKLKKYFYDRRTEVNRELDKKEKAGIEQAKLVPEDFDFESYDEDGLKKLYERVREAEANNAKIVSLQESVDRLNREIVELEAKLKAKQNELRLVQDQLSQMKPIDVKDLEREIAHHEENRRYAEAAKKLIELRAEYAELREKQRGLDKIVQTLSTEAIDELMSRIELPVKGMEIAEDGVLFDGKPFEHLSGREQIEVSLAIARALNGKFGIVCVDGLEKLDDEAFKLFMKMMEDDPKTQYFVTCVGSRGNGIVIEDGVIKQKKGSKNGAASKKNGVVAEE